MKTKICVITGSRAEYGLLKLVMRDILKSKNLELQLIATGLHFAAQQNRTIDEIIVDGFKIDALVDLQSEGGSEVDLAKYSGRAVERIAIELERLKPDIVILLGDRFEILSAAFASLIMRIPIAHINGGEITQGAVDDAMRHAITKMSALHFVTTEEYRNRVIQLGEQPTRVFLVGGLGAQSVNELELLTKAELEKQLDLKFMKKNLIVTFHPATLEKTRPSIQFAEILEAISQLEDTLTIFTYPNADHDGLELISLIKQHVATHENAVSFPSLGQLRYLSVLAQVDGVIGNSSSGLVEAPSFGIGTVNIGSRQKGRVLPESVINCAPICQEVYDSIRKMYSVEFQKILSESKNPHDRGASSKKIVAILEGIDTSTLSVKEFFDLNLIDEREV